MPLFLLVLANIFSAMDNTYMSEVKPALSYSPEGELTLRRYFDGEFDDTGIIERIGSAAELLNADNRGISVFELPDGFEVKVSIPEVVDSDDENYFTNPSADKLVADLRPFSGCTPLDDITDYVFSLDYFGQMGAGGGVFPSFQQWLNSGGLTEEVAKRCVDAMALPFGPKKQTEADRDFSYITSDGSALGQSSVMGFRVVSRREKFGILFIEDQDDRRTYRSGEAPWNWIDLTTLGSCACWGVSGDDRSRVYMGERDDSRLYEMHPHNVDFAVQSLSLVLGAGVLAHAASEYAGDIDLLDDVTWTDEGRE